MISEGQKSASPLTIGDKLYEETGSVTTQRVLDINGPIFENSYVANGTVRSNTPVTNTGTIRVTVRPGGIFFGEGQGVIASRNGDIVTWTSHGLGHLSQGKIIVIGSAILSTSSAENLAFLNNIVGIFEQVVDQQNNNVSTKVWELTKDKR